MKKLIFVLSLLVAGIAVSYAQEAADGANVGQSDAAASLCERKPVTSKFSILTGPARFTNHFLNSQEYSGPMMGLEMEFGRFYRNSDKVSWELTLSHMRAMHRKMWGGGLENAAETSYISTQLYDVDYAAYYNWLLWDRLQVKVGGSFNIFGDFVMGDNNAINNILSVDLQTQFYAAAGLRYGWDFKKFGLDIYGNISMPFMGLMSVDDRYENFIQSAIPDDFNVKEYNHLRFSSFHNLQGVNGELGVDFAFRKLSLSVAYESRNRWWTAYELQNYRKMSFFKIGLSVKLATPRKTYKASERYL